MGVERRVAIPGIGTRVAVGIAHGRTAGDQFPHPFGVRHLFHAPCERLHAVGGLDANDVRTPLRQELRDVGSRPNDRDLGDPDAR